MASAKINLFMRDGLWRYAVSVNARQSVSPHGFLDKEEARRFAEARARELAHEEAISEVYEYDYEVPE
jgi:hypothetical protein